MVTGHMLTNAGKLEYDEIVKGEIQCFQSGLRM